MTEAVAKNHQDLVIKFLLICLFLVLPGLPALAQQQPPEACRPSGAGGAQEQYSETDKGKRLFRIEVEDAVEAELIQQQLKIKPELVQGRAFYYCGNEQTNQLLERYGYDAVRAPAEDVFSRVVRVAQKGREEQLRDLGVTVILREREFWVVRATLRQLRLLHQLGYDIQEIGRAEPRPRQVRVTVSSPKKVAEAGKLGIDIYSVARTKEKEFVIYGGAFDDAIDELRRQGFQVEILPDPPGVTR